MLCKTTFLFLIVNLLTALNLQAQDQNQPIVSSNAYSPKLIEASCDFYPDFNGMGYYYLENQQFDKAEDAFKTYLVLAANDPYAHYSMGDFYTAIGKHDEAISYYKQAAVLGMSTALERAEEARDSLLPRPIQSHRASDSKS